ncbi:sulfotransferase domain-containing protein [Marinobacter sp. C2H3]|uniref:sulfotransferase domain-containing protein n=1 Tax=Marinobacter sp. C2H3 TaxID=3119003 RepID=UPI00300EC213
MKVDFFFIGPSKTASTWLYQVLSEHPKFNVPPGKDIYFFDQLYDKGFNWYHRQFDAPKSGQISGEFSHDYILSDDALERICKYNPEAKIIICLRDPFERTESGIRFLRRNGRFYQNAREAAERHPELISGSLNGANLQRVYRYFERQNVLVLEFDLLKHDSGAFLSLVYRFFDADPVHSKRSSQRINAALEARSTALSISVKKLALIARRHGLGRLVGLIKMNPFVKAVLYRKPESKFCLSPDDRNFLANYFNDDIDILTRIQNKNYDGWKHE